MHKKTWGAIFDFDGVLINSASYHEESWDILPQQENKPLPKGHFKQGFGQKNLFIIPEILKWTKNPEEIKELSLKKEALYRNLIKEKGIQPIKGVINWIKQLKENNIPIAIGSSTDLANIQKVLSLTELGLYFDKIVLAEDVSQGKPNPEVFLKAAKKIQIEPQQCVVFEDAHVGVKAAKAANMKVIAVTTTHEKSSFQSVNQTVDYLDELCLHEVQEWF